MQISATAKYVRVAQRKLLLLAKSVSRLSPQEAVTVLSVDNRSGAREIRQTILSAISNFKSRNGARLDNLSFSAIQILPGFAMKRFRAVSRGTAHSYKKRTSHIKVVINDEQAVRQPQQQAPAVEPEKQPEKQPEKNVKTIPRKAIRKPEAKKE